MQRTHNKRTFVKIIVHSAYNFHVDRHIYESSQRREQQTYAKRPHYGCIDSRRRRRKGAKTIDDQLGAYQMS